MRIVLYKNGNIDKEGYASIDISKPIRLDKGYQYYYIERAIADIGSHYRYYLSNKYIELTTEPHPEFKHLLKAIEKRDLLEHSKDVVINMLIDNFGAFFDKNYPHHNRIKHSDELNGLCGEIPQSRIDYLKSLKAWYMRGIEDLDHKKSEFINNNVFPNFDNWEEKPKEL